MTDTTPSAPEPVLSAPAAAPQPRPATPLLDRVSGPADLKALSDRELRDHGIH